MFSDRYSAGRDLASLLERYRGRDDVLVMGLPRGGVPVAFEIARALKVPLDVMVVRKIGAPGQPEFAVGAVGPGGVTVTNDTVPRWFLKTAEFERQGNWSSARSSDVSGSIAANALQCQPRDAH